MRANIVFEDYIWTPAQIPHLHLFHFTQILCAHNSSVSSVVCCVIHLLYTVYIINFDMYKVNI